MFRRIACVLALCVSSLPADEAVQPSLTIYNQNFAVVRQELPLNLKAGVNKLQVTDITMHLEPDSVILRDPSGTTIKLNLTSLPSNITSMNVYAIDPTGAPVLLGQVEVNNGIGTFTTTTPLTQFMLVASPEATLTAYDANTKIFFRSEVPTGLTVIPITSAVGEQVAAVVPSETVAVPSDYTVPMLGIPTFKPGDETKLKINFSGAMEGARANIFIKPRKHGNSTEVLMHFHDLKEAPKGTAYILWAVSPDNQYQRLGEIVNYKGRNEAEIKSETAFDDFGLLLTAEDLGTTKATIIKPSGHRVGIIEIIR